MNRETWESVPTNLEIAAYANTFAGMYIQRGGGGGGTKQTFIHFSNLVELHVPIQYRIHILYSNDLKGTFGESERSLTDKLSSTVLQIPEPWDTAPFSSLHWSFNQAHAAMNNMAPAARRLQSRYWVLIFDMLKHGLYLNKRQKKSFLWYFMGNNYIEKEELSKYQYGFHEDKQWCRQLPQSWHHNKSRFSVYVLGADNRSI